MRGAVMMAILVASQGGFARADALSDVVDRYVAWRGGAAFEHLQSIHLRGVLKTAGLLGREEIWADRTGQVRVVDDTGVIKQIEVVAAEKSWETAPSGQIESLSVSDHHAVARLQALQFGDGLRGGAGSSAHFLGMEMRGGKNYAVVRVSFGDLDTYDAFIDPLSGALAGFRVTEDRQGRFEEFADWRAVNGVQMPFSHITKTADPDGDMVVKADSIALNQSITANLLARPAPVHRASFANGAHSTGWIDFDLFAGNRIFFPVKINGHTVNVLLDSGATVTSIDQSFAKSIGLKSHGSFAGGGSGGMGSFGFINGVSIEIGNLTLHDINAGAFDFSAVGQQIGHPLPLVLGDEIFNDLAVDIDFQLHRIAFRDPENLALPPGAIEVPLIRVQDRTVPVSIEGGQAVPFEFDLGNGAPLLVFPAYYKSHGLLKGRPVSQSMGGGVGGFQAQDMATLHRVSFAGVEFKQVPTIFTPDILSGVNSNLVQGNIGLPILSRFRLIVEFSRDRLFAVPVKDTANAPFVRNRLGLAVNLKGAALEVMFVSPGSPAAAAGIKTGDRIKRIDQKPAVQWSQPALRTLSDRASGTSVMITLTDGSAKKVKLADFY